MLELDVCQSCRFVLARPHYPENVGATARAIKTMGITDLCLVKPGRLAVPEHEMAHKMAVKAWDVLSDATVVPDLETALQGIDVVFATTSRRGVSGVIQPRAAAQIALDASRKGQRSAFVFGNEKSGLSLEERALASHMVRIPMAADQPSINLAQANQLVAYEIFVAGLQARDEDKRQTANE